MTVVVLDPRRLWAIPVAAIAAIGAGVEVTDEVPDAVRTRLPVVGAGAPTLVTTAPDEPAARARRERGEEVITSPQEPGTTLLEAVAVMDRLRSGSWESAQTHESLRRYLLEETYELLDALGGGDRVGLREELGDVLLQVLFHARIAADAPDDPFTIDDVAQALVDKLNHRVPQLVSEDGRPIDEETRNRMWEERKAVEKARHSSLDGVAMAQPALALAEKVLSRTARVGLPVDLVPALLTVVQIGRDTDGPGAEDDLRRAVLAFAEDVRTAEKAAREAGLDPAALTADDWHAHWPR